MDLGIPELLIILVIAVLLFGPGRLSKIGGELGSGINAFRRGLSSEEDDDEKEKSKAEEEVVPVTAVPAEKQPTAGDDHRS